MSQQQEQEKIFADGFIFKRNPNAPEFVIGRLSMKVEDAIGFINQHQKDGWINLGVKQARSGNYYVELDTFEAKKTESAVDKYMDKTKPELPQQPEDEEDDLPF